MLTANQTKIIEGLISEFEQNNLKNQVKSEGVSLFDKAFERNQNHNLALSEWYGNMESRNAEIKARGQEMLCAIADKLKAIFSNYNIDVSQGKTSVYINILLPNDKVIETHIGIFLATCILKHKAHFDEDNKTSIDKGITFYSHCKLTYNNKDIDVDNFEGSSVFNEIMDKLLKDYGSLITRK